MIAALLAGTCHQLPARTLAVAGVLMPACARCAGFYLGLLCGVAAYALPGRERLFLRWPSRGAAALAAAALVPFAADTALAYFGSPRALGNWGRFGVALVGGWGAWALLAGAATLLRWGRERARRLPADKLAPSLLLLAVPVVVALTPHRAAAELLAAAVLAGAAAFYGAVTYLPVALLLHKRRWPRWAQAALAVALAAAAVAEMRWGYGAYAAARGVFRF